MKEWQSSVVVHYFTPLSENISYTCHGRQVSFLRKAKVGAPAPADAATICALRLENARHYMPKQVNNPIAARLVVNNGP